jgi:hypothetical protein
MGDKCKNCGDPVGVEIPGDYDISLCLRCGLFMVAGFRLRAEIKGPGEYARIESVLLHLEKQYPNRPIRETVTAIAEGLRRDPDWQKTMLRIRERHIEASDD